MLNSKPLYNKFMSIEDNVFQRYSPDFDKFENYGFKKAGKVFTIEKEFNLFVSEPMPIDDIPDLDPSIMDDPNMMNPTNPNMKWYIIGGIGAAVVIIVAVVIIIRKRKKRKQELEGMDDDEIL